MDFKEGQIIINSKKVQANRYKKGQICHILASKRPNLATLRQRRGLAGSVEIVCSSRNLVRDKFA